jgi:hypothetical protein
MRRTGGGMILCHGFSANRVRWDEAKPHMTALHLRKSTGAMSIRSHLAQHAACALESGYVTNIDLVSKHAPWAVNHL